MKETDLVHVVRSDHVRLPLVKQDHLVVLLAWTGQVVQVDPLVSVRPGLQVHGQNQSVAVIKKTVGRLIVRHHSYGGVSGQQLKVVARLNIYRSWSDGLIVVVLDIPSFGL